MRITYEARGPRSNLIQEADGSLTIGDDFFKSLREETLASITEDNRSDEYLDAVMQYFPVINDPHEMLPARKAASLMPDF